jgi:hypothetical protein
MPFGKGQLQPSRKRAAAPQPISKFGRTKSARKHSRGRLQQYVDVDEVLELAEEPRRDDGESDTEENEQNVNEAESNEEYIVEEDHSNMTMAEKKDRKMTIKERKVAGLLVVTQEETRIAVKVCYVMEYEEPDEEDWPSIITELSQRFGVRYRVIKKIFCDCRDGKINLEKQKKGAGRKLKLSRDNAGLIAGAAALNGSASPKMATEICNATNQINFPNEYENYRVCRNTFMSTLRAYTDFDSKAVLRRKTGKKDKESDWAIARKTIAKQMLDQVEIGKKIDAGEITLQDACEKVHKNDAPPPIFPDAVLYLDENHTVASLGGVGQDGSFSRKQYFVSVDKENGQLLEKSKGGVVPKRRYRIVAKYTSEARGCYGVCCPILNEEEKPQFMKTWNYTEKTLVSFKVWKQHVRKEMAYRRGSKYQGWARFKGENPYKERFGDNWEKELANSPKMRKKRYKCKCTTMIFLHHALTVLFYSYLSTETLKI